MFKFVPHKKLGSFLKGYVEKFEFDITIDNKSHKWAKYVPKSQRPDGFKHYAGGPVRPTAKYADEPTMQKVFEANFKRKKAQGINILLDPFKKRSEDIIKFSRDFLKSAFTNGKEMNRVVNLIQAIVRNPILRGDYGHNGKKTIDAKGFDRDMIDTGQMFRAIRAEVKVKK